MNPKPSKLSFTRKLLLAGTSALSLLSGSIRADEPLGPANSSAPVAGPTKLMPAPGCGTIPIGPGMTPGGTGTGTPGDGTQPPVGTENPNLAMNPEGSGARLGESSSISAPNMMGDLLFTSRSVSFGFNRTNGNTNFFGLGSTSVVNSAVAENNSPVPADRLYFRYNYFNNGQSVTGISPARIPAPNNAGVFIQLPQTKNYDVNMYTFGGEATFMDGRFSAELRVPFATTLASQNTLSVGRFAGFTGAADGNGNPVFNVVTTPQNTLGREDTEFGNMTLILKGIAYQDCDSGFLVSGGAGIGIPSAQDARVTAIDFSGTAGVQASSMRLRDVLITNETWSVSPFVAALWVPNERVFAQGFLQVEMPLNDSRITYSDRQLLGRFGTGGNPLLLQAIAQGRSIIPPFTVNRSIGEASLMHLDFGAGYWVYREPNCRGLTGIAPNVELHYTSTLNNSDRVQLPGDGTALNFNPANPLQAIAQNQQQVPEVGPVVGGQNRNMNILDLTVGTTFEFTPRATVATALTLPLTNNANRTFDWEFQLQFNYYFGCRGGSTPPLN